MRTRQTLTLLIATLFVIALGFAGANAANSLQAQPTAIAVVDLQLVGESLKQRQQIVADLRARREQLQQQAQEKAKRAETLKGDLDILQANTPAYEQKQNELLEATVDLQVWQEVEARKLRLEEQLQTENLVRKIRETIGRVAQDNGYDVVLYKGQAFNTNNEQQNQLKLEYVAWHSDSVSITDQVIQRMNNEYTAGQ